MTSDFLELALRSEVIGELQTHGIIEPTPIQKQAIPVLLSGQDLIGQAQTGTGKTLAFALPMLEKMDTLKDEVQALIVAPTRELALQITEEVEKFAPCVGANVLAVYGGQDVERQIRKLRGYVHIVVGTPGRLLDHIRRGTVDFSRLSILVLDEADQMLDMGFLREVEQIIRQTPSERQTVLFSATMPKGIRSLAAKYMRSPEEIRLQPKKVTLEEIRQIAVETTDRQKQDALCHYIYEYQPFLAIVFCRTKRRASALNEALLCRGYLSDELHGDLPQTKREQVMKRFREAQIQILVATDLAARGLDVEGVTHVFNYDIPHDVESYVHRIGRTGRAGQTGVAVTFVSPRDRDFLRIIEKGIHMPLEKTALVGDRKNEKGQKTGRDRQHPNPRVRSAATEKKSNPRSAAGSTQGSTKKQDRSLTNRRKQEKRTGSKYR